MKNENSVMAILAAAVGALCSYAAALVVPLAVLLAVMVGDYVSGMAKAWSTGKLCSKTGLRGILKKLGYLALVAYLKQKYGISTVQRHSDVNATGCPGGHFPFEELAGAQASAPAAPVARAGGTAVTLPLLAQGSRSETVRLAQAALTGLGYDAGGADGIFGANTAAAVKRFQAAHGLAADGIVGRDTWHALLGV